VNLKPGAWALSQSPHDEFLALCALATSGELTEEEQRRLEEHLEVCSSCREAMEQYEAVVSRTIPALATDPGNLELDSYWSREEQEQAEAALFQRLTLEEELGEESATDRRGADGDSAPKTVGKAPLSASQATWRNVWTLYAAGILLFVALGISAYRVGIHRGTESASVALGPNQGNQNQTSQDQTHQSPANQVAQLQQLSDAGHEREILRLQIEQRDKAVASLRHELEQQSAEMSRMKLAQNQLETDLQNGQEGRQGLVQERSDLNQKLEAAQAQTERLQGKLDSLERQSSQDKQRATALQAKVNDLTHLLHDREAALDQQQELLAHDRDIRDLMGARDLYIAEVYDVERTGETKKPYGRVFYTKGKSLIFYAYDLDQQAGAKNASSFQAWGRRGPDRQQALNLGVFYADSTSTKRWVLRFDDPKALEQIDAVFVTVEPNGGSHKPSPKSLLFAYLRLDPNHP
jgi:Putative zinc-finger